MVGFSLNFKSLLFLHLARNFSKMIVVIIMQKVARQAVAEVFPKDKKTDSNLHRNLLRHRIMANVYDTNATT